MKTKLLSDLDENEINLIKENFHFSKPFRDRLITVLNEEMDAISAAMRKDESYEKAAWPYSQADKLGQIKAMRKVISLLT